MPRKLLIAALLLAGSALCFWLTNGFNPALVTLGPLGPLWLGLFILLIGALAWMPPAASALDRFIQRLKNTSPRIRLITSIAVAIASPIYLYLTARSTHRQLFPYIHDEFSYLIQAKQFAAHRLWMPGHPLGQFFDSFQIFTQPVYASAYFPGTALAHLPGVLLRVPPFVTALIISGVVMGLVYWIIADLIDGVAGWLTVLLLLADLLYRQESTLVLSHMPVLMYGLLAFVCWMNWRKNDRSEWAIGTGFFLGLAAVTRPVDAMAFAIPIGIAVIVRCVPGDTGLRPVLTILKFRGLQRSVYSDVASTGRRPVSGGSVPITAIPAMIGGAIPLIVLQLLLNHGITGSWTRTPFQLYADREYPGSNYGFAAYQPHRQSESALPQMRAMYDSYRLQLAAHQWKNVWPEMVNRARFVLSQTSPTPFPVLVFLMPLSIVGIWRLRNDQRGPAIMLLSLLPLFLLLYAPYFLYLPTYTLPTAPAVILAILLGMRGAIELFSKGQRFVRVGLVLLISGLSLAALPNWWNQPPEDLFSANLLADVSRQLAGLPPQKAVVFFTFDPKRNLNEEPVYNADSAWPDDAAVIRVHDLGSMNSEVIRYYAERQPDQVFYWYDEATRKLNHHAPK
jgi:4-amino-4-deoxy-L-arabinose transferase-like glycosyltransferase